MDRLKTREPVTKLGIYLQPAGTGPSFKPSRIECPYCHEMMLEIACKCSITRHNESAKLYGDILPQGVVAYYCRPCTQSFCVDTREPSYNGIHQ